MHEHLSITGSEIATILLSRITNPNTPKSKIDAVWKLGKQVDINDKAIVKLTIFSRTPKKNITIGRPLIMNLCSFMTNDKLIYPSFIENGYPDKCPFRVGEYSLYNFTIPVENFPFLPQGKYAATLIGLINNIPMLSVTWLGQLTMA